MTSILSLYNERFNILPLEFALPYFALLIAFELIAHWNHWNKNQVERKKFKDNDVYPQKIRPFYRINDSITSIICGICELINGKLMSSLLVMYVYAWVYHYFRFMDWEDVTFSGQFWNWVLLHSLAFFLKDYFYYWFHRAIHEVNIGWAVHAPHHNSEEYNLTTALRQGMFQAFLSPAFYIPMALIGIPPEVYSVHTTINLLWQFWIHTRAIGKFHPLIEYIFNTPSHHRLHHGRNPEAIDKNYGGTLIIFDRIHGTFEAEGREVLYGTIHPIQSFNVLTSQLHHLKAIIQTCISKGLQPWQWVKIIFLPPGVDHSTGDMYPIPEVDEQKADRYNRYLNWKDIIFASFHFVRIIIIGVKFLKMNHASFSEKLVQWMILFFNIVIIGYICDGFKGRVQLLETIRCAISFGSIIVGGKIFVHLYAYNHEGAFKYYEFIFSVLSILYANFMYSGDSNAVHEWELEQKQNELEIDLSNSPIIPPEIELPEDKTKVGQEIRNRATKKEKSQ